MDTSKMRTRRIANPGELKTAHTIDLHVRRDGVVTEMEADWVKHVPRLYAYLRHATTCKAGSHCEDPFCHYGGECSCGLDAVLALIPGSPVRK